MYATSNSHFKGLQTVMARLRPLIISNLISPQSQINWSPDHQTSSCDYTHDSPSSTIYTRVTNLKQCMYAHTNTHTCTHVHTHTMYTSTLLAIVSGVISATAPEKRQRRQHHYTTPIQTQLTTQVWTSLIFLHHTATNLLNVTGS